MGALLPGFDGAAVIQTKPLPGASLSPPGVSSLPPGSVHKSAC